jgi:alkylated DNA repair dioxygenase AlkB
VRSLFDFEDTVPRISGLTYLPQFLDADSQRRLVDLIDQGEWDTSWERRRQLYGQTYGDRGRSPCPFPEWGRALADKAARAAAFPQVFDQMLVNEYLPGQGIALHRDYEPFDRTVVSISLLSSCVMDLRRVKDNRRESILLEPLSLLSLSDGARYEWEHGIARRKNDRWKGALIPRVRRISVTFRRLKSSTA